MKRVVLAVFALLMAFSLCLNGAAETPVAGTYSVTINNVVGNHTYQAYQIFKGDLYDGTLSNIQWGNGVTAAGQTALGDAAALAASLENADGTAFAEQIAAYLDTANAIAGVQTGNTAIINVTQPGYYLVKDADGSLDGQYTAYTPYILSVLGKVEISPKSGNLPVLTKQVKEIDDAANADLSGFTDIADLDALDVATFQITGTLPSDYDSYTEYTYIFHDIASVGLEFDATSLKVYVDGNEITQGFELVHTDAAQADGCTFELVFDDLKDIDAVTKDSTISVEYNCLVSKNYVFESENKVTLEYSNNVYTSQTGTTTPEYSYVYSYKLVINKVDENSDPLAGASFKVTKKAGDTFVDTAAQVAVSADGTVFTLEGLDAGVYCLTETATPDGYNTMNPMYFCIESTVDSSSGAPALTGLTAYECDVNGDRLSQENFATDPDTGVVTMIVVNQKGSSLPTTGGVGTVLLYTLGGLAVVSALVLFVAKKRAELQ